MRQGIADIAVYVPSVRLQRSAIAAAHAWAVPSLKGMAKGTIATANWDEDSVTMAHAACRQIDTADLDALTFCSTSMPFADRSHSALLAEALSCAGTLRTQDSAASARAGTTSLASSLERAGGASLVVAAERRLAKPGSVEEMTYGDAAVAIKIGTEDLLAEYLAGTSIASDFVDHYRASDSNFDYGFEARWVRDEGQLADLPVVLPRLLDEAQVAPEAVKWLVMNAPSRVRQKIARSVGLSQIKDTLTYESQVGRCGAVEPLLGLAEAIERADAGDVIVAAGFAQGVDVLVFRATGKKSGSAVGSALNAGTEDDNYLRFLSHRGLLEMDWGKRAERDVRTAQSAYYRQRDQISAFVGGRCSSCGTIQFPRTRACVNPDCRAFDTQEPYPMAELIGTIKSFTEDWQAYSPAPPLIYGNIGFDGGANIFMQFTDTPSGTVQVGDRVRVQFRIKDIDRIRGFRRYFWKAVPIKDSENG